MSHVLVIDDDPQVRTWIRDVLDMEGLAVTSAADGRHALELAGRQAPSVALVDVTLPIMDGTAVSTALRALLGERFPIVLMSAGAGVRDKAARVGAAAYLQKPFTMDDLLEAIQAGLSAE
jgi:DNA-binding response OmpR family regulator